MNIDSGIVKLWSDLSEPERLSGRWVALTPGEHARVITIEESERRKKLAEIFKPDPAEPQQGRFDAMGRPVFGDDPTAETSDNRPTQETKT
jgi:hypothetical protein